MLQMTLNEQDTGKWPRLLASFHLGNLPVARTEKACTRPSLGVLWGLQRAEAPQCFFGSRFNGCVSNLRSSPNSRIRQRSGREPIPPLQAASSVNFRSWKKAEGNGEFTSFLTIEASVHQPTLFVRNAEERAMHQKTERCFQPYLLMGLLK